MFDNKRNNVSIQVKRSWHRIVYYTLTFHEEKTKRLHCTVPLITSAEYKYQNNVRRFLFRESLSPKGNGKTVAYISITKKDFEKPSGSCIQQLNKGNRSFATLN